MTSPDGRRRIALELRGLTVALVAGGILAVVVAYNVFVASHQVLGWVVAAGVVAVIVHPVIERLDGFVPRPIAYLLTFLLLLLLAVGFVAFYSVGVLDEVGRLADDAPAIAQDLEDRNDRIGRIARDVDLADQVQRLTDRLNERTQSGGDVARSAALSAPPFFVSGILTVFLLVYGPAIVSGAVGLLPDRHRRRVSDAVPAAARSFQIYVGGSFVEALVSGGLVFVAGKWLDVPAVPLLALAAVAFGLVPYVGIAVGWIPLVVLGVGTSSFAAACTVALLAGGLQIAEAVWWRRLVDRRSVHVGPAVIVIVAVIGFSVYGIGGALCACALAVYSLALADELADNDEPLPTALDDTFDAPNRAS